MDWIKTLNIETVHSEIPKGFQTLGEIQESLKGKNHISESHLFNLLAKATKEGKVERVKVKSADGRNNCWVYKIKS